MSKYADWIDDGIADIRITQTDDIVWLEVTKEEFFGGYLKDQTIKRTDLAFIKADFNNRIDRLYFDPKDSILTNSKKFEDFDSYSISMTVDIFNEVARDILWKLNNK